MLILITVLIVFVILIIEIPFSVFINISIDRVLLEYMLESPIKTQGYAYIKNGELFHGGKNKESEGGIDTVELISFVRSSVIVKSLHIRGIFGEEEIEKAMVQGVIFSSVASEILHMAHQNNQFARLSQAYQMESGNDNNIFLQGVAWLSVFDVVSTALWIFIKALQKR